MEVSSTISSTNDHKFEKNLKDLTVTVIGLGVIGGAFAEVLLIWVLVLFMELM